MRRHLASLGVLLILIGTGFSAFERVREESRHRRTALAADWAELKMAAAREANSTETLLEALYEHGIRAIVVQPLTLEQLWQDGRVMPWPATPGHHPLDTPALRIEDPALASLLYWEWTHRGVTRLLCPQKDAKSEAYMLAREGSSFLALKDVESAYDLDVLAAAQKAGLGLVFRVSQDPWLAAEAVTEYVQDHPLLPYAKAVLWNTESPLGGSDAFGVWKTWMGERHIQSLLFEFKPPRNQRKMARALPSLAHRAHTISLNELREMRPDAELARWRRAALERSCRFLLVHISPDQAFTSYLAHASRIGDTLQKAGLTPGWPENHPTWQPTPGWYRLFLQLLAFALAALGPLLALYLVPRNGRPVMQFLVLSAVTLACALTAAALANMPETRLQITPFRGIKLAFLIGWLGSLFILFRPQEMAFFLGQSVRRLDLVMGMFLVGVLGYVLLRTGNAGNAWASSFEQPVRNALESFFVVRPRFKEFAFGHPLLFAGLLALKRRSPLVDPRFLLFFGMLGQVSMTNTFAHLHSPLVLGLSRSLIGLGFGVLLGWVLNKIVLYFEKRS